MNQPLPSHPPTPFSPRLLSLFLFASQPLLAQDPAPHIRPFPQISLPNRGNSGDVHPLGTYNLESR